MAELLPGFVQVLEEKCPDCGDRTLMDWVMEASAMREIASEDRQCTHCHSVGPSLWVVVQAPKEEAPWLDRSTS